jgi:hypothetical protein
MVGGKHFRGKGDMQEKLPMGMGKNDADERTTGWIAGTPVEMRNPPVKMSYQPVKLLF